MSNETKAGLEQYATRSTRASEWLALLQASRARRRPQDAHLASATLEAVELIDGASTALECSSDWSMAEVRRLRVVANLLLENDLRRMDEQTRASIRELVVLPRVRSELATYAVDPEVAALLDKYA